MASAEEYVAAAFPSVEVARRYRRLMWLYYCTALLNGATCAYLVWAFASGTLALEHVFLVAMVNIYSFLALKITKLEWQAIRHLWISQSAERILAKLAGASGGFA